MGVGGGGGGGGLLYVLILHTTGSTLSLSQSYYIPPLGNFGWARQMRMVFIAGILCFHNLESQAFFSLPRLQ